MNGTGAIWKRHLWLWSTALVFLLLNVAALVVYRVTIAGEVQLLDRALAGRQEQLEALEGQRREIEDLLERAARNRQRLAELYRGRFSTESRRLTQVISEVRDLASRAGLAPNDVSYPEENIEDFGLVKRSFVFTVDGTYPDLRKFIYSLELSDSFLTLERISLAESLGGGGSRLRINLRISTLFATEDATPLREPLPAAEDTPGGEAEGLELEAGMETMPESEGSDEVGEEIGEVTS